MDYALVKIVSAEAVVARSRLDLNLRLIIDLIDFQNGDVEGSSAQIEDEDGLIVFLVDSVGQSGSRWFVDDSKHFESSDSSGILSGLTLCICEVCWTGDDRLLDLLTKIRFCIGFQLL